MVVRMFLQKEIKKWVEDKTITKEEAIKILKRYDLKYDEIDNNFSIVSILGYMFLGFGLLILIAKDWKQIPTHLKSFGLISVTLATYIVAYINFIKYQKSNLFFLTNLFYGASIMLITKIYDLDINVLNIILFWVLGSFFVAVFVKNKWVNLQALFLATIWSVMKLNSSYPYLFWLFLFISGYLLYTQEKDRYFFIAIVLNLIWFLPYSLYCIMDNYYLYNEVAYVLYFVLSFYALYLLLYFVLDKFDKRYFGLMNSMFLRPFYLLSFLILFEESYESLFKIFSLKLHFIFYILIFCIVFLSIIIKQNKFYISTAIILGLIGIFKFVNFDYIIIIFISANFVLFLFYVYMICYGVYENDFDAYRLGVISIFIFVFVHYLNLISQNYNYVATAVFLFICAIFLLSSVKIFKKIKRV